LEVSFRIGLQGTLLFNPFNHHIKILEVQRNVFVLSHACKFLNTLVKSHTDEKVRKTLTEEVLSYGIEAIFAVGGGRGFDPFPISGSKVKDQRRRLKSKRLHLSEHAEEAENRKWESLALSCYIILFEENGRSRPRESTEPFRIKQQVHLL
jgi:hypothetical protein